MKIMPLYKIMKRPVVVTKSLWYELLRGPYELEDGSFLYLARPTGQMFPPLEFQERRYYIRIARAGKELVPLNEERMGDKLRFRRINPIRIADRVHDVGYDALASYFFRDAPSGQFAKYQISVAKIHNKNEWMDIATIPALSDLDAEKIKLTDMKLSVNGFKYLKRAKVENLQQLLSLMPSDLEEICHGNKAAIQEYERAAESFGMYFVKLP